MLLNLHEENRNNPDWRIPGAITERPELDIIDMAYLKGYYLLTGSRRVGMGVSSIPLSEIKAYLDVFGPPNFFDCADDNVAAFVDIITRVDNHYLIKYNEKQDKETKKSSPKPKRK